MNLNNYIREDDIFCSISTRKASIKKKKNDEELIEPSNSNERADINFVDFKT